MESTMETTRISATTAAKVFLVLGLLKFSITFTSLIVQAHLAACGYDEINIFYSERIISI